MNPYLTFLSRIRDQNKTCPQAAVCPLKKTLPFSHYKDGSFIWFYGSLNFSALPEIYASPPFSPLLDLDSVHSYIVRDKLNLFFHPLFLTVGI